MALCLLRRGNVDLERLSIPLGEGIENSPFHSVSALAAPLACEVRRGNPFSSHGRNGGRCMLTMIFAGLVLAATGVVVLRGAIGRRYDE